MRRGSNTVNYTLHVPLNTENAIKILMGQLQESQRTRSIGFHGVNALDRLQSIRTEKEWYRCPFFTKMSSVNVKRGKNIRHFGKTGPVFPPRCYKWDRGREMFRPRNISLKNCSSCLGSAQQTEFVTKERTFDECRWRCGKNMFEPEFYWYRLANTSSLLKIWTRSNE